MFTTISTIQTSSGLLIPATAAGQSASGRYLTEEDILQFQAELARRNRSPATIEKYLRVCRRLRRDLAACNLPLTHAAVTDWLLRRRAGSDGSAPWCAKTENNVRNTLNALFRTLELELHFPNLKIQESDFRPENRDLSRSDFDRLLHTAQRLQWRSMEAMLRVFRETGIRVSELQFFTVERVQAGMVTVRNKGKIRQVPLAETTQRELLAYCAGAGIKGGVIFTRGTCSVRKRRCANEAAPVTRNSIWRQLKHLARLSGVEESRVYPHNLRHLFAVELYEEAGDYETVRRALGHSNVQTTVIYLRVTLQEHRAKLERVRREIERKGRAGAA